MSSTITIPILPSRDFNVSILNAAEELLIPITPVMNVTQFYYATLYANIDNAVWQDGAEIAVVGHPVYPGDRNPIPVVDLSVARLSVTAVEGTDTVPYANAQSYQDLGPAMAFYVKFKQGSTAYARFWASMSASLILRTL